MRALVGAALRLRWVVTALSLLLLIVGFRLVQTTPLDVFPEFSPLLVEVQTEAPGLSTAEVSRGQGPEIGVLKAVCCTGNRL